MYIFGAESFSGHINLALLEPWFAAASTPSLHLCCASVDDDVPVRFQESDTSAWSVGDRWFVDFKGAAIVAVVVQNVEKLRWRDGLHDAVDFVVADVGGDDVVGADALCTAILQVVLKVTESCVFQSLKEHRIVGMGDNECSADKVHPT